MDFDLDKLQNQAAKLLRKACNKNGIWASPTDQENYRRIWARDSMIAGIAGLIAEDEEIIRGLRDSIITLAKHQHPRGMIPSNVLPDNSDPQISYGTLAGRVDANTWFVIGSCLYLLNHPDDSLRQELQPNIQRALTLLDHWEFNGRGLLYTPLSGNWADEYPVEGHTLYDNTLRLWALKLYNKIFEDAKRQQQAAEIRKNITINFWPDSSNADHPAVYHKRCFKRAAANTSTHFACAIGPKGYNTHFDTAGNGFALLLQLATGKQFQQILEGLKPIFRHVSTVLLPAFWPVITSDDPMWDALKNNYSYDFKNYPHQYHNGGIWPVWMGWFALGSSVTGNSDLPETMLKAWMKLEDADAVRFSEYIASDTLEHRGKEQMCYSASGLILLIAAIRKQSIDKLHLNTT
jgi:glycogen debranching enzyme